MWIGRKSGRSRLIASVIGIFAPLASVHSQETREVVQAQPPLPALDFSAKPSSDGVTIAGRSAAESIQLDAVDVQGPGAGEGADRDAKGYVATDSAAATKTDTPLIEVPQSVSIVTQQQMQDRNVQTVTEAVNYTAGVETGMFGFDPRFDSFYIRGFDMTYTGVFRDGLREPAGSFSIYRNEPYGLQSIAVVRGPTSALYGLGSPGGLIDLISKRPPSTSLREAEFQIGNFERYQGQFDFGGPLDPQGIYSYRLTGLVRNSGTQLLDAPDNRYFIAPAFSFHPDAATSLTILTAFQNQLTTGNPGFYQTPGGQLTNIYSGDPAFQNFNQTQFRIGYIFEHAFNEAVTFRQNARYSYVFADVRYTQIDFVDPETYNASRSTGRVIDHLNTFGADNQALVKFNTGPVSHFVLFGFEYTNSAFSDKTGFGWAPDLNLAAPQPNYGGQFIPSPLFTYNTYQSQQDMAVYLQDQIKFGPFVLTLSGRNDWVSTRTDDVIGATSTVQNDEASTGRVGLTYLSPIGLAPYVSYATAFTPTLGTGANGAAFGPVTGDQKEVGVKYQPPGINGLITASLFDIHQFNSLSMDPNNQAFQIQTGEIRSRGFELEGVLNPLPALNVTLAYTYLDQKILDGDADTIGKSPSGIPAQSFSVWGDYTLQPDTFAPGLGGGFGMRFIGQSYGNDQNTMINPQTTLFDAALHYDFANLDRSLAGVRLQVNATNLFNTKYQVSQAGFGYWGQDRTIVASLRYRW
ncbi:TonB-dependent siderophore receptor [Methylocella silvestris BL2]|uniref:TonB-dependent siderophore receptor n=1 Tax=Methylocella silvestris (strain DSM 15510 / CIP 108128 / LMG 27833 / NCIMB 13906 / BL2) TaxID=395965 RepID=B8EQL7_METSB|nr:TonB-dependent siderophore receptor [Methylocella silvestris]ACK52230.1 TonB-dependent siderophore receptor [Methylocella silvestris BL2]